MAKIVLLNSKRKFRIQCGTLVSLLVVASLAGCTRILRKGPLIDRYKGAECISPIFGPGISPPTRAWSYTLTTHDGVSVHIVGAEKPGGRIDIIYRTDGKQKVAADAGDYVYPSDVRFDAASSRLYIKASGIGVIGGQQTWLFEYDLNRRRQTKSERVDPRVLPEECRLDSSR